jgi:hypothetical protein
MLWQKILSSLVLVSSAGAAQLFPAKILPPEPERSGQAKLQLKRLGRAFFSSAHFTCE